MKVDLLDMERLIAINKLQEVTSPRLFSNKMTYDPNGILSTDIFGISKGDRRGIFAYIDLKRPFLHPHIYGNILKRMFSEIKYIVSGQKKYTVKDGVIVQDENGWTGIGGLYDHWDEIDWRKRKSTNERAIKLLSRITKDQAFITKIPVCPPAYRDVMLAGTRDSSDHVNEVNKLYIILIRARALLSQGSLFARTHFATQMKMQDTLVEISNYFKNQISKKAGLIRKYLIGKSVDFGTRSVISAPTYNNETMNDNMIDINHTAVPLSQCCSTFYPFIETWLKNFFTREIINDPNLISFYDEDKKQYITATLKEPEVQFSDKAIKKLINDYVFNPDNRFKIITVDVIIPSMAKNQKVMKAVMVLKGKVLLPNNVQTVLNRPMTITDILYLACAETCEKRHIMVSRYPVGTDKGLFFNKIRVQSTKSHVKVIFNGKEYPFYPDIDFKIPHDKVGVQFIDSLVFSNSLLEGMGGDYDGDTVSIRGIWTEEANLEVEEIMNRKMTALNITGSNSRVVSKEIFNSYYALTKIGEGGKVINQYDHTEYLSTSPDGYTRTKLSKMFADTANTSEGNKVSRKKARHATWDKMTIPANYFYEGHAEVSTTIGRFVFNKYVLQGSGVIQATGLITGLLNKGGLGDVDNLIGQLYREDVITRAHFNTYIDRRDNLGYWLNGMLAHSISLKMLKPMKEIEKKKKELFKKYEKEIQAGNIDVMTQISNELVDYAKELLKDDPGMDLYLSGDLDFGNNYKNNAILKGPVMNKITNEFDFIGTSFMGGIDPKDIPAHANSILSGQFPASIATKDSGYMGKKLLALLQMTEVDEPGTDCHTKNPIPITIDKGNKNDMVYSYIDVGGQLQLLTRENIDSYVGKTVMMRSPMSCTTPKICSKCAGELFYKLDIKQAGLFATQLSHSALNLGLKSKHVQTISLYQLDPNKIIEDI